jgi:hypothetical protein
MLCTYLVLAMVSNNDEERTMTIVDAILNESPNAAIYLLFDTHSECDN